MISSKQMIGVKRGLLRLEPLYLCSREFRKIALEEKLKGFEFEIAHIE
jgi:ribosomal protein S14